MEDITLRCLRARSARGSSRSGRPLVGRGGRRLAARDDKAEILHCQNWMCLPCLSKLSDPVSFDLSTSAPSCAFSIYSVFACHRSRCMVKFPNHPVKSP